MQRVKLFIAALLALTLTGCPGFSLQDLEGRDARMVANTAALTLEASQATTELLYEFEQRMTVETALKEEGITKTEIRTRLAKVRERWDPAQALFVEARELHSTLAEALVAKDDVKAVLLVAEYAAKKVEIASAISAARARLGGSK